MTDDPLDGLDLDLDTFSLTFAHEALDRDLAGRDAPAARRLLLEQVQEVARALDRSLGTFRTTRSGIRRQREERLERAWKGQETRKVLAELRSAGGHFRTFVGFSRLEKQIFQRYEESASLSDFLQRLDADREWWRQRSPLFGEKRAAEIARIGERIHWSVQHVFDAAEANLQQTFGPQIEKAERSLRERLESRVSWLRLLLDRGLAVSAELEREIRDRFDALVEARIESGGGDPEIADGLTVVLPAFEKAGTAGVLEADPANADALVLEQRFVEALASLAARRERATTLARRWRFDDGLRSSLAARIDRLPKEDEYAAKSLDPLAASAPSAESWLAESRRISTALGQKAESLLLELQPFRLLAGRAQRTRELEERVTASYRAAFADFAGGP